MEYDLVIIGGSATARYAAGLAAQRQARVALVEPAGIVILPFSPVALYQNYQNYQNYQSSQLSSPEIIPADLSQGSNSSNLSDLSRVIRYSHTVTEVLQQEFDLAGLSRLGVDVILGRGEFSTSSRSSQKLNKLAKLAFVVEGRVLRSHRYLLSPEAIPVLPEIPGLETVDYLTATDLGQEPVPTSQSWVVMGNPYTSAEVSQFLKALGMQVTLVSPHGQIFPQEEPIVSTLLQGQMETEGIRLLTHSPVTLVRQLEGKQWVQAGDRAIETEQILLCPQQVPNTQALNLEAAGVRVTKKGIIVNQYLQTTNPCIYACSHALTSPLGAYQVQTALNNALIFPLFLVNYQYLPRVTYTKPPLARVGMTEQEARQRHGKRVITLREYLKDQPLAQIRGDTTGFCQLVVKDNGVILGATIVGSQAAELISLVTLGQRSGLRLRDLAQLPEINGSLLQRTAAQGLKPRSKLDYLWEELKRRF